MNFDTKIETKHFRNMDFLIKRDDLIDSNLNGNKAYKFYFLLNLDCKNIVSYGGNQSNAMSTLSYISKIKKINFTYFTTPMSSYLKNNITGNLKFAMQNKIDIKYTSNPKQSATIFAKTNNALLLPQGGALREAKIGLEKLAKKIIELKLENLCVFYSSGTGTSALFLASFLKPYNIDLFTTNCIGSKKYLMEQFLNLQKDSRLYPQIISTNKKLHFAKPNIDIIKIYKEWIDKGIEFDLLYDCVMWLAIADNIDKFLKYKNRLFIHSGGLSGNETQLKRYEYKKLYNP